MRLITFLSCLILAGCARDVLYVEKEFLGPERYASVFVGSPDPRKMCPELGERLNILWKIPRSCWSGTGAQLWIRVRYLCGQEEAWVVPICQRKGRFEVDLKDDWFRQYGGFRTYVVHLTQDGCLLAESKHLLWEERIELEDEEEEIEEDLEMQTFEGDDSDEDAIDDL